MVKFCLFKNHLQRKLIDCCRFSLWKYITILSLLPVDVDPVLLQVVYVSLLFWFCCMCFLLENICLSPCFALHMGYYFKLNIQCESLFIVGIPQEELLWRGRSWSPCWTCRLCDPTTDNWMDGWMDFWQKWQIIMNHNINWQQYTDRITFADVYLLNSEKHTNKRVHVSLLPDPAPPQHRHGGRFLRSCDGCR